MKIGLGWHIRQGDRAVVWHNGRTGGFASFIGFVQGGDLGVVVLTNTAHSVDDIGAHLLDPEAPLMELAPKRRIPLFRDAPKKGDEGEG